MIERILNWFRTAKPQPSLHDAAVQIGCHYEEVAEMAEAVDEAASMPRPFMDLIKRAIKDMAHSVDGGYAAATSRSLKTAARYLMRMAKLPKGETTPRPICGVLPAVEREAV